MYWANLFVFSLAYDRFLQVLLIVKEGGRIVAPFLHHWLHESKSFCYLYQTKELRRKKKKKDACVIAKETKRDKLLLKSSYTIEESLNNTKKKWSLLDD